MPEHIEFLHKDHFEEKYHRKWVRQEQLASFIDFFWETDFDALWPVYPEGFSDILFPNTGYTYLINLGTPFVMQLGGDPFEMKSDGFLPRHKSLACHHAVGNKIFGIKFKISPLVFEKKVNFSEYREYIYPLSYLIDRSVVAKMKEAPSFQKRVELITAYYKKILDRYNGSLQYVTIVADILQNSFERNEFDISIEKLAKRYGVSTRTLQRYFESATSICCKQALQIMRIRKAVTHLTESPASFRYADYGYYDNSHFYKHLKQFFGPLFRKYQLSLQTPGTKNPAAI